MDTETTNILAGAGWSAQYQLSSETLIAWRNRLAGFSFHQAAKEALSEFGGLKVDMQGPGLTMARQPFQLDPTLACGEEDLFKHESERLGKPLFPLGEGEGGHYYLAIADDGCIYAIGFGCIDLVGESIVSAIENLVHGRKGTRLFED